MDKIFRNTPKFTATDWLIDAVIAAGAFGFCCLQLTVAVNLLIPDEFMRRLMGIQAMVPSGLSLLAIALTTLPLVLRRKFPWAVFVWCLVSWGLLQAELNGIALSVAGPPHRAVHAGLGAIAGRGGHRVRGHVPRCCCSLRRPRSSRAS